MLYLAFCSCNQIEEKLLSEKMYLSNVQIFYFHFLIQYSIYIIYIVLDIISMAEMTLHIWGNCAYYMQTTMLCKRPAHLKTYVFLRLLASNLSQIPRDNYIFFFCFVLWLQEHTGFSRGCVICDHYSWWLMLCIKLQMSWVLIWSKCRKIKSYKRKLFGIFSDI